MEYHVTAKQLEDAYRQQAGREPRKEVKILIAYIVDMMDRAYYSGRQDERSNRR